MSVVCKGISRRYAVPVDTVGKYGNMNIKYRSCCVNFLCVPSVQPCVKPVPYIFFFLAGAGR